jgi:hypothetical protein
MSSRPSTVPEFFAALPEDRRRTIKALRAV